MDTVVTTNPRSRTAERDTYIERTSSDSTAGWAIAIILLVVLVGLGLYFWARSSRYTAPSVPSTINISNPGGTGTGGTGASNPGTGGTGSPGSGSSGSGPMPSSGSGAGASGSGSASGGASGSVTSY